MVQNLEYNGIWPENIKDTKELYVPSDQRKKKRDSFLKGTDNKLIRGVFVNSWKIRAIPSRHTRASWGEPATSLRIRTHSHTYHTSDYYDDHLCAPPVTCLLLICHCLHSEWNSQRIQSFLLHFKEFVYWLRYPFSWLKWITDRCFEQPS